MYVSLYEDKIGKVEYVQHMGSDLTIVNSARVSFGKTKEAIDEKDKKLIKYLAKNKHTSTFEHNVVTFRFIVPLYIRSQHHRHRTWSYNEISRRYTDLNIQFYEPKSFRTQSVSNRQASNSEGLIDPIIDFGLISGTDNFSASMYIGPASTVTSIHHDNSLRLYNLLVKEGVCREQARGVLPQNMYTQYYGTVNLNNLIKFIDLRLHDGAQFEIQQVAKACLSIAKKIWPFAVSSYMETSGLSLEDLLSVSEENSG